MAKKIFISFPMSGKTFEEIVAERDSIFKKLKEKLFNNIDIELINSVYEDPFEHKPLWYLGLSIQAMSEADIAIFAGKGWKEARGCQIEYACAKQYGLQTIII